MHRLVRLSKKQDAKLENEAGEKPRAKKTRLVNRISRIATLDNGTMVESFKYLNYCQLAKNSLVSKRFLGVIRTHRLKLAFLYVDNICMERRYNNDPAIKIFNNELSPEEYNDWVVQNNYSKQTLLKISTAVDPLDYVLSANGNYKDPNEDSTSVFYALIKELNRETWPLFEHFIRLLTDPFVFIRDVRLSHQYAVFNLLAATIDSNNRALLQCENLQFDYDGNAKKFFNWIEDHMRCVKFRISVLDSSAYCDRQLLDFFATGSHCTSEMSILYFDIPKIVLIDLLQKFVGFKNSDESQMVELICGHVSKPTAEALKNNYAKFFVKREIKGQYGWNTAHVFEFINADIGKKLQLTVKNLKSSHQVILEITNL